MTSRIELTGGTVVELSDEGAPTAPAVVLLHGFTGNKEIWRGLRRRLRKERRVLAIDLPGHGGTRVADRGGYSMAGASALVLDTLGVLGVREFSLVGYSMGGRLALHMALAAAGRVRALVLESASAGLVEPAERSARSAADEELGERIESGGIEAFVREWESLALFASLRDLPEPLAAELRRQRLGCDPAGLAASLRGMSAGTAPWLGDRLGELRIPVLVVAGERDLKYVAIARDLASRIPGARLAIFAGAGHLPHLERAADFEEQVAYFLQPERSVRGGIECRSSGRT